VADAVEYVEGLSRVNEHAIYPHVFQNADREVGGVLIGTVAPGAGLPLVSGAIPALSADEQRATLTFTQETWEHVHHVLDTEHPDKQIVGWYHSHPGFGIFLSEHDLFIHRNFFSGAAQIALVVDPLAGTEGVFCWHADEIATLYERPTGGPWIGVAGPPPGAPARAPAPARRRIELDMAPDPTPYPLVAIVLAVVLGLGFGLVGARLAFDNGTPEPTPTPAQTREPTPERTVAPAPTTTVEPSPTPGATVEPSPTPGATVAPSPTPRATADRSPRPARTAKPSTAVPSPAPTTATTARAEGTSSGAPEAGGEGPR
jgi:proteasome lid subunit RPN8/RPN11